MLLSFGKWQAGWSAGWSAPCKEDQTSSPPCAVPRATSETSKTFVSSNSDHGTGPSCEFDPRN